MVGNVTIGIGESCRRQTRRSPFSYYDGSDEELLRLVLSALPDAERGYVDGVLVVPVPPANFYSGVVPIASDSIVHLYPCQRREFEEPFLFVSVEAAAKLPADHVDIVMYSRDMYLRCRPGTDDDLADWEIVSINASVGHVRAPMTPPTIMRNALDREDGMRDSRQSAELLAALDESFAYWKRVGFFHDGREREGEVVVRGDSMVMGRSAYGRMVAVANLTSADVGVRNPGGAGSDFPSGFVLRAGGTERPGAICVVDGMGAVSLPDARFADMVENREITLYI